MTDTVALHEAAEAIEDFGLRSDVKTACHEINRLRSAVEYWEDQVATLREALEFYGDPDTYFAIAFFPDPPCGELIEDFEEFDGRNCPGKRARQALAKTEAGAAVDNWIRCEDELPKSDTYVLTRGGPMEGVQRMHFSLHDGVAFWDGISAKDRWLLKQHPITHWKLLPDGPQTQNTPCNTKTEAGR